MTNNQAFFIGYMISYILFHVEFPKQEEFLTTSPDSVTSSHRDSWRSKFLYRQYHHLRIHEALGAKDGGPGLLLSIFLSTRVIDIDK